MFNWNDYGNGVYGFDSGYVRPELAAIYLMVENGRAAFVDSGSNDSVPKPSPRSKKSDWTKPPLTTSSSPTSISITQAAPA